MMPLHDAGASPVRMENQIARSQIAFLRRVLPSGGYTLVYGTVTTSQYELRQLSARL